MMDESTSDNNLVMVCPFFLHAVCPHGDNCDFSHEMTGILPNNVPCEFHLRGMCKYGKNCWYSHGSPKKKQNVVSEDQNDPAVSQTNEMSDDPQKFKSKPTNKIKMRYCFRHKRSPPECPEAILSIVAEMRKSYSDTVKKIISPTEKLPMNWCFHYYEGKCPLGYSCPCIHGIFCELCYKYCLHPNDSAQRRSHLQECEKELERDMELAFGIHNSRDKPCGICLEVVLEKEDASFRKFGILEKCNHVFCLSCIREWRRQGRRVESIETEFTINKSLVRACPTCRVPSGFVTPSKFWFGSEEEKMQLISKYKAALKNKHCKYFKRGDGKCRFGGCCFYLHAMSDGTIVELSRPTTRQRSDLEDDDIVLLGEIYLGDVGVYENMF